MQSTPTSAVSSASSTGSGAPFIGRGPKSSSSRPVNSAPPLGQRLFQARGYAAADLIRNQGDMFARLHTQAHVNGVFRAGHQLNWSVFQRTSSLFYLIFAPRQNAAATNCLARPPFPLVGFDAERWDLPAARL